MDVPAIAGPLAGVATIIDGDTIKIAGQRIRFRGIDAPKSGQTCEDARAGTYPCGLSAAGALKYRLDRRPVICTARDRDRYGRPVAVAPLRRRL